MRLVDKSDGDVMLPGSQKIVLPLYPRGDRPSADEVGSRRMQLGIWMVSRDNPFLARAAVNRAWAFMFGRGLVEPVDDIGDHNRASQPQLFDELAAWFVDSGFDLRNLLRMLASTRAYQLSSRIAGEETPRPEFFARMPVKALTPEQFYDSLARLAGGLVGRRLDGRGGRIEDFRWSRRAPPGLRGQDASPAHCALEYDAGVAQVLLLLNGDEVLAATGDATSGLLTALRRARVQRSGADRDIVPGDRVAPARRAGARPIAKASGRQPVRRRRGEPGARRHPVGAFDQRRICSESLKAK